MHFYSLIALFCLSLSVASPTSHPHPSTPDLTPQDTTPSKLQPRNNLTLNLPGQPPARRIYIIPRPTHLPPLNIHNTITLLYGLRHVLSYQPPDSPFQHARRDYEGSELDIQALAHTPMTTHEALEIIFELWEIVQGHQRSTGETSMGGMAFVVVAKEHGVAGGKSVGHCYMKGVESGGVH